MLKILKNVREKIQEKLFQLPGIKLMDYYKVDLEMGTLVLYLVIQEVGNLGH
jgi:hypothetical protein